MIMMTTMIITAKPSPLKLTDCAVQLGLSTNHHSEVLGFDWTNEKPMRLQHQKTRRGWEVVIEGKACTKGITCFWKRRPRWWTARKFLLPASLAIVENRPPPLPRPRIWTVWVSELCTLLTTAARFNSFRMAQQCILSTSTVKNMVNGTRSLCNHG